MINLEKEQELYMKVVQFLDESMEDYLYLYHFKSNRLYLTNRIGEKYEVETGREGASLDDWIRLIDAKDRSRFEQNIRDIRDGVCERHEIEYRIQNKHGNKEWVYCRGNLVKDKSGKPDVLIGSITELAKEYRIDNLTGLWSFEKFMLDLERCVSENRGYLMIFGFDDFRNINTKKGRRQGDALFRKTGEILEELTDQRIKAYRMDGDCFAVNFIEHTKEDVEDFYGILNQKLEADCSISAGAVSYQPDTEESGAIIQQYARNALERAKKGGKAQLVFFTFEDYQRQLESLEFQEELACSVKNGCEGFYLCYQPQMDNRNFELYGAEALLRYQSPSRGPVSPAEFIPILEQTGMIRTVGEWVLRTALKQCARWRETLPAFHMNVNVSNCQLLQKDIVDRVLDALYEAGVPGEALTLELTESIQLQDYGFYNKMFTEWKRRGIKIAIDDFGTGYSSLSYLRNLDVDETKIDRCFVSQIQNNSYNYLLLNNIIDLAHRTRIQVCCEGVETEEELMALQELHPDILQGFLFATPYREKEFEEYYLKKDSAKYKARKKKENILRRKKKLENTNFLEMKYKNEIVNIIEGIEDAVYVADKDTGELFYMNSAGRRMTGEYHYKGRKCYEVFQGRETPCEKCKSQNLSKDFFHNWKVKNQFLNKHYLVKDKLILWNGKEARLEIAIDISNHSCNLSEYKERLYRKPGKCSNTLSGDFSHRLLDHVDLGMWVIRLDAKNGKHEMYTDTVMNRLLGLSEALDPEACYSYWRGRIGKNYAEYVKQAVLEAADSEKVCQVQYNWIHPELGEVPVCCVGVRAKDREGMVCIEGYHRMMNNLEVLPLFQE